MDKQKKIEKLLFKGQISKEIKLQKKINPKKSLKKIYSSMYDRLHYGVRQIPWEHSIQIYPKNKNQILKEIKWMEELLTNSTFSFNLKWANFIKEVFKIAKKKQPSINKFKGKDYEVFIGEKQKVSVAYVTLDENPKSKTYLETKEKFFEKEVKQHGKGILFQMDGKRYVGEFKKGYRNGKGVVIDCLDYRGLGISIDNKDFKSSTIMTGRWNDDFINGLGTLWNIRISADSGGLPYKSFTVKFKFNRQVGNATAYYPNGSKEKTDLNFEDGANLEFGRFFPD